ncbi:MAG: hypothetical protein ACYTXI_19425 [Nostoc sp.]
MSSSPLPKGYGVQTSQITPLNPPLEREEARNLVPPQYIRGGLGWGKNQLLELLQTCVYTVAPQGRGAGGEGKTLCHQAGLALN